MKLVMNPVIPVIKNNNLVFNTGDVSLSGYGLKVFYDNKFNNELVSIGSTLNFNVISAGSTTTVYQDTYHQKFIIRWRKQDLLVLQIQTLKIILKLHLKIVVIMDSYGYLWGGCDNIQYFS